MIEPRDFGFQDMLAFSQGDGGDIEQILIDNIPSAFKVSPAALGDDKNGVDYLVWRTGGPRPLGIDVKRRGDDPIEKGWGDDVALETWSDVQRGILGWTLNPCKLTDYIMWYWEPTCRWMLIPFPMLLRVFTENRSTWTSTYKVSQQSSNGGAWISECVFVPRKEVWSAVYRRYGGSK
jgi:hypothetical protein